MTEAFVLSEEQRGNLSRWKEALTDPRWADWRTAEATGVEEARALLGRVGFARGTDLEPTHLDDLFRCARTFSRNRLLSRLLYERVGVGEFNRRLRILLYGGGSIHARLDQFLGLTGIGGQTTSQLLCLADPQTCAFVSDAILEPLGLTAEQEDLARRQAFAEAGVADEASLHWRVPELLARMVVLRAVKECLGVKSYLNVNMILWHGRVALGAEDPETAIPAGSVGLERDLRDHIAANPGILGKGLELFDPEHDVEYPTGVGPIDVLLKDSAGKPVVVETKRGRSGDAVVGQTLRYMGWLMDQGHPDVRGLIVVHEEDPKLLLSLRASRAAIDVRYYAVRFEIGKSPIR